MKRTSPEAYQLLHDGALALARVEDAGIRIDTEYLQRAIRKVSKRIVQKEQELMDDKIFRKHWLKSYGGRAKLGSTEQLAHIFFKVLGYQARGKTETFRDKADEAAFSHIDEPFLKNYFTWKKYGKLKATYLEGILREVVDGYLHPFFNLHTVSSYRSSSSDPNFQNMPIRNKEIGGIIRKCFVPREGHALVEIDFVGIEVRIAAAYHKDPTMLEYINDPTKDMHRDMGGECYLVPTKEVNKDVRYCGKNLFVFPQFYGSFYVDCAKGLWEAIDKMSLVVGEKPLKQHLKEQGIRKLGACNEKMPPEPGTFEAHIKAVEQDFWGRRFPTYAQWKDSWYRQYRLEAGFTTLTGFRINGLFRRNEVINLPVQGSAFHCLLWSLTRIVKWLLRKGMKSKVVGQIHDSILIDCHLDELQEVLNKCRQVMTMDLLDHWQWINTPMDTEVDVALDNWAGKLPWVLKNGAWSPKEVA